MKILAYEEYYEAHHAQKWLEKTELAYDLLNEHGLMNVHFDKEEFMEDAMRERYESDVSEVAYA